MTPKFRVAINRCLPYEKLGPQGTDKRWARFNRSFRTASLDPVELFEEVRSGHAFCAELGGCQLPECGRWCLRLDCNTCGTDHCGRPHGYRCNRHFLTVRTLELDFDTGDERSAPDYWQNDEIVARFASFAYETISSAPDCPRWRLVFVLDRSISEAVYARRSRLALIARFPWSDRSINDPSRFFYGAKQNADTVFMGHILPMSVVDSLIEERNADLEEQQAERDLPPIPHSQIVGHTSAERYANAAIQQEAARLSSQVEGTGERHKGLLLAALKLGSLKQSEWLPAEVKNQIDPLAALLPAARKNGYVGKYGEEAALRTIADGVAYAKPRRRPASWEGQRIRSRWSGGQWVKSVTV